MVTQEEIRQIQRALAVLMRMQSAPRARTVVRTVVVPMGGAGVEVVAARADRLALLVQAIDQTVDLFTEPTSRAAAEPAGLRLLAGESHLDRYPIAHRGSWYARATTAPGTLAVMEWIAEDD